MDEMDMWPQLQYAALYNKHTSLPSHNVRENGILSCYHSIAFHEIFRNFSLEELRLADRQTSMGTRMIEFFPTHLDADPASADYKLYFQSITSVPPFDVYCFEELRLEDYKTAQIEQDKTYAQSNFSSSTLSATSPIHNKASGGTAPRPCLTPSTINGSRQPSLVQNHAVLCPGVSFTTHTPLTSNGSAETIQSATVSPASMPHTVLEAFYPNGSTINPFDNPSQAAVTFMPIMQPEEERRQYMQLHHTRNPKTSGVEEQLRTVPLLSFSVKCEAEAQHGKIVFPQYGFLGCHVPSPNSSEEKDIDNPEPLMLNTNTPWSAFLCGSQGSGKSYTLSVLLENCLYPSPRIGKLPHPLAGIVFHNNTRSAENVCEAAHLVSLGVKVKVLVSRSNFPTLDAVYKEAVDHNANLKVERLVLKGRHLTAERMHRLMAFGEGDGSVPLYMEVILRILRDMAMVTTVFDYNLFKDRLNGEGLQTAQKVMMNMRLNLLESFLDMSLSTRTAFDQDIFCPEPGSLTIVDLSDPFLDSGTTCTLFDIALSLFEQNRPRAGMLVALDEAHKFMQKTPAAEAFTEHLLTTIREQRHNGTRVVIATQEPTISPKLLDLCSMTFVHRFTSPDWLTTLRCHLAGASDLVNRTNGDKNGLRELFERIVGLDVGESLLFAPSAVLELNKKLGIEAVRFKTRLRLGADGGRSVLAVREKEESVDGEDGVEQNGVKNGVKDGTGQSHA